MWFHFVILDSVFTSPPIEKATRLDEGKQPADCSRHLVAKRPGESSMSAAHRWFEEVLGLLPGHSRASPSPDHRAILTHSPAHKQVRRRISTPPDALEDDAGVKDRECGIRTYSGSERWSQMALERVDTYLETHRSRFEEQLKDLIRIPSISAQPDHDPDTQRAAAFVRDDLSAMGL